MKPKKIQPQHRNAFILIFCYSSILLLSFEIEIYNQPQINIVYTEFTEWKKLFRGSFKNNFNFIEFLLAIKKLGNKLRNFKFCILVKQWVPPKTIIRAKKRAFTCVYSALSTVFIFKIEWDGEKLLFCDAEKNIVCERRFILY